MKQAIAGARIFTGKVFLDNHCLIMNDGIIEAVISDSELDKQTCPTHYLDGGILAPGFIDTQVNGGADVLFNNEPTLACLGQIVQAHRRYGSTGIMPTLITDQHERITSGVAAVQQAVSAGMPGILGVHLEGPFLSKAKRGTHHAPYIRQFTDADINGLSALSPLKVMLTLAPEHTTTGQISALVDAGIIVCAGHSNASSDNIVDALQQGLRGFTHLFNAMSAMQTREPGVVGAALYDNQSWCGIIADGYHVDPMCIGVAVAAKPRGKIMLVTDAMATVGGTKKSFTLYDQTIDEKEGKLINAEGNLAGSAIGMIDAVKFMHQQVHIPLEECLCMASLYPAQFLQLDGSLGYLQAGYHANMVHFNEQQWTVCSTWIKGVQQSY